MNRRLPVTLMSLGLTAAVTTAPANADAPTCLGQPATIVGTAGNDVLRGTDGPDVIWAGAGYDDVKAYGGDAGSSSSAQRW